MKYEFPHITNISQVLPHVAKRPEFIVAEKDGGYTVINYLVQMADTFPPVQYEADAILRECRGMIFNTATGAILRRPLHKFFNLMEKEETQLANVDFSESHTVFTKLDGSFLSPFIVEGKVRFGTKMGLTEVALQAEPFITAHPEYLGFSAWCIENGITPIFEYTAPDNRIVIHYDKPMLTLLACRNMITGEYLPL